MPSGVKTGTKRGPYRGAQDKLDEYLKLLPGILSVTLTQGYYRPRQFFRILELKKRFGQSAVEEHRRWFFSKRYPNLALLEEWKHKLRAGRVTRQVFEQWKHKCYEWRWLLLDERVIDAWERVSQNLDQVLN